MVLLTMMVWISGDTGYFQADIKIKHLPVGVLSCREDVIFSSKLDLPMNLT